MLPKRMRRAARRLVVASLVAVPVTPARAQAPAAPDALSAPWTLQGRAELRERLNAGLHTVRRRLPLPPGVTAPAAPVLFGVAACMADGALWTSAALVEGAAAAPAPPTGGDASAPLTIEAAAGPGPRPERPVIVARVDSALGLAALHWIDAAGQPALCSGGWVPLPALETGGLTPGRVVYAAVPGDARLRTVTVQGPGRDPFGWYWAAEGDPLPPGTPVFDAAGRWLGMAGPQAPDAPTRSHLLPDTATQTWVSGVRAPEGPP